MMEKKGVSPVVATVLLIAIVIVLAIIIFLWAKGFVAERAQKFGRAVELSCDDVNFQAGVFYDSANSEYVLDIVNNGNVPIYGFSVKTLETGSVEVAKEIFDGTITIGDSVSISLGNSVSSGDELLIIPVILGETDSGKVAYTCPDNLGFPVDV